MRFPDGSRRKVERIEKADAQRDLDELLALRAQSLEPGPRHTRKVTFNEVIDAWFADGCPNVAPTKKSRHARAKSPNTVANARQLLGTSIRPVIGHLWVDRRRASRLHDGMGHSDDRAPPLNDGSYAARRQPGSAATCRSMSSPTEWEQLYGGDLDCGSLMLGAPRLTPIQVEGARLGRAEPVDAGTLRRTGR